VTEHPIGTPDDHTSGILQRLVADPELVSQLTLRNDALISNNRTKSKGRLVGYLSIIIYGPRNYLKSVGDFMTQCGRYLEDPIGCDHNVPYLNPQCLFSMHGNPPMTFDLMDAIDMGAEDKTDYSDILAGFETPDILSETPTPDLLQTTLKPYVDGNVHKVTSTHIKAQTSAKGAHILLETRARTTSNRRRVWIMDTTGRRVWVSK
jgi:SWI/SNF-related matrix-associated actin-dependent regulator of chromatin subfamily A3